MNWPINHPVKVQTNRMKCVTSNNDNFYNNKYCNFLAFKAVTFVLQVTNLTVVNIQLNVAIYYVFISSKIINIFTE